MARFDGARQGLAVWLVGLLVVLLLAAAGGILGAQYNVLQQLNLPRIPIDEGTATTAGIITLVAILLVTLLGAVLGGKLGERYHRKVDRAGFDRLTVARHTAPDSSAVRGRVHVRSDQRSYAAGMCRNIRPLSNFEPPATDDEIAAAALQYVRKISGTTKPSRVNAEAFDRAVAEVAAASHPAARRARHHRAAQGPRGRGGQGPRAGGAALRHLTPERRHPLGHYELVDQAKSALGL